MSRRDRFAGRPVTEPLRLVADDELWVRRVLDRRPV
jgi:hypothetical protein